MSNMRLQMQMSLSKVYWRNAWPLLYLPVPCFLPLLDNRLTFLFRVESIKLVFQHHQSACWILSLYLLTWKKKSPLPSESAVISMLCRTHKSRYTKFNTSAKHMSSNQSDGGLKQTVWWTWKLHWKNTDSPFASGKTAWNFRADFLGSLCRGFCLFWISLQKNNIFIYVFYSHLCENEKCKAVHKKQLNAARRKSVSALRQ